MADLIDIAPAPTTPDATPAPAPDPAPTLKRQVDLDSRLEEVLSESRRVADLDKSVAARLKKAEELETRWGPKAAIDEFLTKGERAAAVKALLGSVTEDDLFSLAALTADQEEQGEPPPSIEAQVNTVLAAREKAAEDARIDQEKAEETQRTQAAQTQIDTFLTNSAKFLKANTSQFPFIQAWGCDSQRYTTLMVEQAEKTGAIPEPTEILQKMEDEHRSKWSKSPFAPKALPALDDLDAHVTQVYRANKPAIPDPTPPRPMTAYDRAKQELDAYDKEQAERIRYRQGR